MRVYLSFAFMLLGLTVGQPSTAATIAVQPAAVVFKMPTMPLTYTWLGILPGDSPDRN